MVTGWYTSDFLQKFEIQNLVLEAVIEKILFIFCAWRCFLCIQRIYCLDLRLGLKDLFVHKKHSLHALNIKNNYILRYLIKLKIRFSCIILCIYSCEYVKVYKGKNLLCFAHAKEPWYIKISTHNSNVGVKRVQRAIVHRHTCILF
jgi:hypothetical protein